MSGGPVYTIDQLLDPIEHKATHDGLADGSEAVDANKLELYRREALNDFIASGGLWSADDFGVDLLGSMTSVVAYIGGKRILSSAVSAHAFTASKYTAIDLGDDGVIDYNEGTDIASIPALATNHIRLGLIITNGSNTTHVFDQRNLSPLSIARNKLVEGTSGTVWVDNLPNNRFFKVVASLINSGTINCRLQFNGDTGSNYGLRYSTNFGGSTTSASSSAIELDSGSPTTPVATIIDIINTETEEKLLNFHTVQQSSAGAATIPVVLEGFAKWANTSDLINRIDITESAAGAFGAGSELIVSAR